MIQTALLAGWGTAVFAASAAVQQAKPRFKAPVRTSPGKTYIPNVDPEDLCPVCEGTCKVFCQACSGNGASVTVAAVIVQSNDVLVPIRVSLCFVFQALYLYQGWLASLCISHTCVSHCTVQ